jgi:4-amino-4-deoxy-L-arabinose transferase-like glycosyltransferase
MNSFGYKGIKLSIIALFLFLTIQSAKSESLTFDEIFNLQEGVTNVTTRTFPIEPYNPPLVRELAVLPTIFGFTPDQGAPNERYFLNRLVIIFLGAVLLWQVMNVAYEYFGFWPSILSGMFLSLEPTVLAHSHYITPDMGLTLFVFLSYKAFLNVLISPTMTRYFFFGVFFGLAAASKISALPFLLVSFALVYAIKRKTFPLKWHIDHAASAMFSLMVAGFIIWGTYFFRFSPVLIHHENPQRLSNKILAFADEKQLPIIRQGIELLQGTPVPLGDYVGIFKNTILRAGNSEPVFHMGTFHESVSLYMMPHILLTKLSLPFLLFILLGMLLFILPERVIMYVVNLKDRLIKTTRARIEQEKKEARSMDAYKNVPRYKIRVQHNGRMDKEWNDLFIIPLIAIFFVAIVSGMNPLVRYVLPAFPFLAIIAGSSIQILPSVWKKRVIIVLFFWLGMIVYQSYPHFLSYTNELIPKHKRFEYMIDSNIDWGQGLLSFKKYIEKITPSRLTFSYFGRDDASWYGFLSNFPWGSHKNDEICAFHTINYPNYEGQAITAISVTNWYVCGYHLMPQYAKQHIRDIVADSILVF